MKIDFIVPKLSKQVGGLEKAINGLRDALSSIGHDVQINNLREDSIVHFHGLWEPGFHKISKKLRTKKRPYLVSPHGMLEPWALQSKKWKKNLYYRFIEKALLQNASAIIATGNLEKNNLSKKLPKSRIENLFFGVDKPAGTATRKECREKLGVPLDKKMILFLSRADKKKGLDILIHALSKTPNENVELHVAGEGPALEEWKSLATSLEYTLPTILWHGAVWGDEKWDIYQSADLFCLPTHSENFGFVIQEALSVGTPCLTTIHTPWTQFNSPGITCIDDKISTFQDYLTDWSQKPLITAIEREELKNWTFDQFDWKKTAESYVALYDEILST